MTKSFDALSENNGEGSRHGPYVVGIGASAGGIAALQKFFAGVDPDGGLAYVVILHLSPEYESRLAEVLQTTSRLPVTQVADTVAVSANHVYVVPPNKSLSFNDGHLTAAVFTRHEQRISPVDAFFRALADTHGSRAACVILSGTGSNGSSGLKRVKEYGGLVVAQDPAEAEYADMPRNAVTTGQVDLILPVADIPARIHDYFEGLGRDADADSAAASPSDDADALRDVLALVRVRTGQDFSNYKVPTLRRRIERRMSLRGTPTMPAYARLMRREPQEAVSLMKELLISVTNFFRDSDAWTALEERVIPRLFLHKRAHEQVRVWVAGCATGEEAYSVAMLLAEHATTVDDPPAVQVFATDLDVAALDRARDGTYSDSEVADLRDDRLQRFFQRETRGYKVRRDLRELVLFATHNVITDPPFSHLDLVSCRNVLIYLNRTIQGRVIETFHFALRPGGYLFVGGSEAPDGPDDLFLRIAADAHLYESRTATSRIVMPRTAMTTLATEVYQPRAAEPRAAEQLGPADLHQRVLEQYAPPSVLVNESHTILHMSDRAGRYLQFRGGEPSRDLLIVARAELRADLRAALHQAARDRTAVHIGALPVTFEDGAGVVDVRVNPVLRDGDSAQGLFLVLFDEASRVGGEPAAAPVAPDSERSMSDHLENDLARVKAQLRTTVEQYETQAEEAKASNEELQAMNEELRSAAEELETSKEELQSLNEELSTVNQELKIKIDELGVTNSDFQNFINATDIGTIFLDRDLKLKLSTPRAREVFNLLESDAGRPLSDITSKLRDHAIHKDVRTVLDRLSNVEREVQTDDERWYYMRILPYRTMDNRIDGVVLTFQDVTQRREAEMLARAIDERMRVLVDGALDYAIFTMRDNGEIDSWNAGAQRMFGYSTEEIVGASVRVLFTPEDRAHDRDVAELQEAARTGRATDERFHLRKDGSRFYCSGVTRRLGGPGAGFAKIARDLTLQREAGEALQRAHDDLEARVSRRTSELADEVRQHQSAKEALAAVVQRLVTAQEDERRRVARDLHDDMGQRMTAIRMMLEQAQQEPSLPSPRIDQALHLIAGLGGDLDFLSWQLRPGLLDELGLSAALPTFVSQWSAHTGIPAEFRLGGFKQGQLGAETETAFYRVAQEALNNIAKHAHATRADIVLGSNDGEVVLVVEDDGIGFEASDSAASGDGFGLTGMRERAALVGAALDIETSPGRGTSVFLRWRAGQR